MVSTEKLSGMKMETSFLINMSGASLPASRHISADFHHALLSRTRCLPFLGSCCAGIMITHQPPGGGGSLKCVHLHLWMLVVL